MRHPLSWVPFRDDADNASAALAAAVAWVRQQHELLGGTGVPTLVITDRQPPAETSLLSDFVLRSPAGSVPLSADLPLGPLLAYQPDGATLIDAARAAANGHTALCVLEGPRFAAASWAAEEGAINLSQTLNPRIVEALRGICNGATKEEERAVITDLHSEGLLDEHFLSRCLLQGLEPFRVRQIKGLIAHLRGSAGGGETP